MTRNLNEAEARNVISGGTVGHLGCIDNGGPYVVPINYLFEENAIYSHSLPGQKIRALRANPRACLQVEQLNGDVRWRSAIAFGSFEEIRHDLDRAQALRKLLKRFPLLTPVESRVVEDAAPPEMVVFRILIDRITGVAEG